MWKDLESKVDLVNHRGIAAAIVGLVKDTNLSPLTIGVHGDWGSGKSTILEMVRAELIGDQTVVVLTFNGWLFQGFEDAKIAIMEAIIGELQRDQRWQSKLKTEAVKLLKRVNWLKVARKATAAALAIPTSGGSLLLDAAVENARSAFGNTSDDDAWLREAEQQDATRQIHEFREEFKNLLSTAGISQLVVIVDDLDRCLPSVAIDTLEALRLFLFVERTAFIIAADEALIEYAVREHFPGLPYSEGPAAFTRNYLEKLIQIPFRLPPMTIDEARSYISLLFVESAFRNSPGIFGAVLQGIAASRSRPWEPLSVDASSITKHLPGGSTVDNRLREQLLTAERVSKPLATGSRGNPRQIKRFLNTLMLRMRLAEAYRVQDQINEAALAKLMLLERFNPSLFRTLTESVQRTGFGNVRNIDTPEREAESPAGDLPETLSKSDIFADWAHLEPPLDGQDLRPYLFISREYRPDYVGDSRYPEIPPELISRVSRATQIDHAALVSDLRALPAERAERLVDIVLTELRNLQRLSALDGTPLRGLGAIAEAHPALQVRLIDAIDAFPVDRIGAFLPLHVRTWATDPAAVERLAQLQDRWEREGDKSLKEAVIYARSRAR